MYKLLQIFKRDFFNMLFNPMWVFYSTVFPFLLVLILGFLSSGNYGSGITSYDYYSISMMLYTIFNTSTLAANSFMEERIKQGNMRIIYAPMPKAYIYISKIVATFLFSSICHLLVIVFLQLTLKANFGESNFWYIVIILLLFELFASTLGVMFCCILKSESTTNQILSVFITMFGVFGGLFFRLDGFGKTVEKITYISPVKWIIIDIFKVIYDNDFSYYLITLIILIVLTIMSLLMCKVFYRTEDYV